RSPRGTPPRRRPSSPRALRWMLPVDCIWPTEAGCKARLAIGDTAGALADADEATRIAPKFPQCHLLRGDALFAMGEYHSAEDAFARALDLDPSIRRSKSFKVSVEKCTLVLAFHGSNCSRVIQRCGLSILTLPCPGPLGKATGEACQCQQFIIVHTENCTCKMR
uniref:Uncharacterized protein n=1 Tax=Aegilops tauschii subsp. strangulata TaxID=200361 RepID=A0A453DEM8_AEGTS